MNERVARVETKQEFIETAMADLVQSSREQRDSIAELNEGFNNLSKTIVQLTELERSSQKNTAVILDMQKDYQNFKIEQKEINLVVEKHEGYINKGRYILIGIVLMAIYNYVPGSELLKLLLTALV